ncbi:VOC family protein [Streptomyces capparidis]
MKTGHIGLNVTDLDRSAAFYERLLGFSVATGDDGDGHRWAFLGRDGELVLALWHQSTGDFPTANPGLHHLSFQVDSMDEVRAAERVLRELGADFHHDGVVPHGEGASSGGVFFTDPDGIRLEIYATSGAESVPAPSATAPTCGFF